MTIWQTNVAAFLADANRVTAWTEADRPTRRIMAANMGVRAKRANTMSNQSTFSMLTAWLDRQTQPNTRVVNPQSAYARRYR